MNNFAFVSALIRGDWAIEHQFALNSLVLVDRILDGSFAMVPIESPAPYYIESRAQASGSRSGSIANKVMVIPVTGVLMKGDGACGSIGMATMANFIKAANQDPEISGIVLAIDSPGGSVDGTELFSKAVKASGKPVVAWVDGMAASAALWIASAASEIIASSPNDEIGSVGAMLRLQDNQPALEKDGVRFHTIISDQTPDKNKHALEIQQGKYDNFKADHLNPLAQNFIDAVKANRDGIESSFLTGKMYFAKNAMGAFVDRIGSLDDAIARVQEMATQPEHSNQFIQMTNFERINAALGVEQLESADGNISLNEDQLALIEAALGVEPVDATAAVQDELNSVQAALTETQTALDTATADLTAAQARISELEAQVTELEREPGAEPAKVVKVTDGVIAENLQSLTKADVELFNLIRS